jgi:hypothetical protein
MLPRVGGSALLWAIIAVTIRQGALETMHAHHFPPKPVWAEFWAETWRFIR